MENPKECRNAKPTKKSILTQNALDAKKRKIPQKQIRTRTVSLCAHAYQQENDSHDDAVQDHDTAQEIESESVFPVHHGDVSSSLLCNTSACLLYASGLCLPGSRDVSPDKPRNFLVVSAGFSE